MRNAKRTILLLVLAITASALTCTAGLDSFEPDANYPEAASITTDGQAQPHSIYPAADEDWLIFTIEARSDVVIETSGISGDTEMWLYNEQLVELSYDDEGGAESFSRIQTTLPAGTYYVRIKEYNNKALISEYFVSVLATPIKVLSVSPNFASQCDNLIVTITGQNTTFFQGGSTITNVWLSKGSMTIDANSFTGIDATTLEASFNIPADALAGSWDVHVSNSVDGELPSFIDGFTIYAYPTKISSVSPNSSPQGDNLVVTITGPNTTFFQGGSTITNVWLSKESTTIDANSFTGIDATTLEASFNIPADAPAGEWDVHVRNSVDGELPSFTNGFTIYAYPDLNGDGKVDAKDFAFFAKHWLEVAVPNVVGIPQTDANSAIESAYLVVGNITYVYDDTVPSGSVISSEPAAGVKVNAGSAVNLLISVYSVVPNVTGMTQAEAQAEITDSGLIVGTITEEYSDIVADISSDTLKSLTLNDNFLTDKAVEHIVKSFPNLETTRNWKRKNKKYFNNSQIVGSYF